MQVGEEGRSRMEATFALGPAINLLAGSVDPESSVVADSDLDADGTREGQKQTERMSVDRKPTFASMPSAYSTFTTSSVFIEHSLEGLQPPLFSRKPTIVSQPSTYSTTETYNEEISESPTSPDTSSVTLNSIQLALAASPAFPSPPSTLPSPSIASTRRTVTPPPVTAAFPSSPYSTRSIHTFQAGSAPSTPRGSTSHYREENHGILRSRVSMDAILPGRQPSVDLRRHSASTKGSYQGSPRMPFGTPQLDNYSFAGPSRPRTPSVVDHHSPSHADFDPPHDDPDDDTEGYHPSPALNVTWEEPVVDGVLRSAPGVYGLGEGWAGGPQPKPQKRWFRRKRRSVPLPTTSEDPLALWQDSQSPQSYTRPATTLRSVWNRSKAALAILPSRTPASPTSAKSPSKSGRLSRMAAWSKSHLTLSKPIVEEHEEAAFARRAHGSITPTPHYRKVSEIIASPPGVSPVTPPGNRRAKWLLPISPSLPELGSYRKAKDLSVVARRLDHIPGPIPARRGSLPMSENQVQSPTFSTTIPATTSPIMWNTAANASAPAISLVHAWRSTTMAPAVNMPLVPEVEEPRHTSPAPESPPLPKEVSFSRNATPSIRSETFGLGSLADGRPGLRRTGTFGSRATTRPSVSRSETYSTPGETIDLSEEVLPGDHTGPNRSAEDLRESVVGLDTLKVWAAEAAAGPSDVGPRKRSSLKGVKSALNSLKHFSWSRSTLSLSGSSDRQHSTTLAVMSRSTASSSPFPALGSQDNHADSIARETTSENRDAAQREAGAPSTELNKRSSLRMFNLSGGNTSFAWLNKRLSRLTEEDESSRRVSQVISDKSWRISRHQSTGNLPLGDPFQRIYGSPKLGDAYKSTSALNEVDLGAGGFEIDDILDHRRRREIVKRISMTDLSVTARSPTFQKRFSQSEYNIPQSVPLHTRNTSEPNSIANSTTSASTAGMPHTPRIGRTIYIDGGASGSSTEIIPRSLPFPPRPLSGIQKRCSVQPMASAQSSMLSVNSAHEVFRDAQENLLDSPGRKSMDEDSLFEDALEDAVPMRAQKADISSMKETASYVSLEYLAAVI